jgi:hypothetical protein
VFGVAVLATVWSQYGSYETGPSFVDGMLPALWIGAIVVALGAVAAFAIGKSRVRAAEQADYAEPLTRALENSPATRAEAA